MPDNKQQKRQIAYKARISDILYGKYVKESGWQPNYVLTEDGREISKVNIVGMVISKDVDLNYESIVLDDGSANITVRSFERNDALSKINIGDFILVIGRPREFGSEKYIIPEIIKKIENTKWAELRKLEMKKEFGGIKKREVIENVVKEEADGKEIPSQKIYNLTKALDKGDGADIEEVINRSGLNNAEEIINELIREGELFQNKAGRLKILD